MYFNDEGKVVVRLCLLCDKRFFPRSKNACYCASCSKAHPNLVLRDRAKLRAERIEGNGGKHTRKEWEDLKKKFGYRCAQCGRVEGTLYIPAFPHMGVVKLTKDHVIPVTMGGTDDISNIQPLCRNCNSSKGNRSNTDYREIFFEKFGQEAQQHG